MLEHFRSKVLSTLPFSLTIMISVTFPRCFEDFLSRGLEDLLNIIKTRNLAARTLGVDERGAPMSLSRRCASPPFIDMMRFTVAWMTILPLIDVIYRLSQKQWLTEKNQNQNWVPWGKIFRWTWLGSPSSYLVLVRNDHWPTNIEGHHDDGSICIRMALRLRRRSPRHFIHQVSWGAERGWITWQEEAGGGWMRAGASGKCFKVTFNQAVVWPVMCWCTRL